MPPCMAMFHFESCLFCFSVHSRFLTCGFQLLRPTCSVNGEIARTGHFGMGYFLVQGKVISNFVLFLYGLFRVPELRFKMLRLVENGLMLLLNSFLD